MSKIKYWGRQDRNDGGCRVELTLVQAITIIEAIHVSAMALNSTAMRLFEQKTSFNEPRYEAIYGEGGKTVCHLINFNFMRLK